MERATWAWWKGQGGDAPISQHRRLPANHRKQGRGMEQSFSHRPQREPSLPISCSQTSSLQNSEAIDFWGLNHLPCDICYSGPRKALHDPSPWRSSCHCSASGSPCFLSPSVEKPGSLSASTLEESRKGAGSRPLCSLSTHGNSHVAHPTSTCWLCLGNTQISPGRQETGLRD